jgi:hypothetical protein
LEIAQPLLSRSYLTVLHAEFNPQIGARTYYVALNDGVRMYYLLGPQPNEDTALNTYTELLAQDKATQWLGFAESKTHLNAMNQKLKPVIDAWNNSMSSAH